MVKKLLIGIVAPIALATAALLLFQSQIGMAIFQRAIEQNAGRDIIASLDDGLLDVIAPNRQLATAVLTNFKQIAGEKPVSIHPIVARSVDPEVLEKMRVKGGAWDDKGQSDAG